MIRRAAVFLFAAAVAGAALAKAPPTAPVPAPRPAFAPPAAADIVANAELSGQVAYLVVDLDRGEALEGANIGVALPPASVAKAPTALFALDALGPDYRFATRLLAVGSVRGGVLFGDLVLQGGGDPETDTNALASLALQAAASGLKRVEGRFLVDDAILPMIERIDGTQPETAAYNPSVGALNLNYNRVWTEWRRGGDGYRLSVEARADGLSPPTDAVEVEIVGETGDGRTFERLEIGGRDLWRVRRGALGRSGARWLPTRTPALYAGDVFRSLAASAGLETPAPERGAAPVVADVIAQVESRPLREITRDMLRFSTNLTAEALGLAASRTRGEAGGSLSRSAGAMNAWVAGLGGFPVGDGEFALLNHSGLSAQSAASVRHLVAMLAAADQRSFPALAGGRPATLRALMPEKPYLDEREPDPPYRASLRAKTGTLNFVSALAGYLDVEDGRRLAFAILTADLEARARVSDPLAERQPGARSWSRRSRDLQWRLLRSWITRFGAPPR